MLGRKKPKGKSKELKIAEKMLHDYAICEGCGKKIASEHCYKSQDDEGTLYHHCKECLPNGFEN